MVMSEKMLVGVLGQLAGLLVDPSLPGVESCQASLILMLDITQQSSSVDWITSFIGHMRGQIYSYTCINMWLNCWVTSQVLIVENYDC